MFFRTALLFPAFTSLFSFNSLLVHQQLTNSQLTSQEIIAQLSAAIINLKSLRAVVDARERIGSKYIPAISTIKLLTTPRKVYIKTQKGIEVLYVAGQNGGDAWVYPASFPYITLSLNPLGSLMRHDQHHTTQQVGFGTIADLLEGSDKLVDKSFNRSFRYAGDSMVQHRTCYVLRSDYPQFRYITYKVGKNETIASIATRYGCGEYRIAERNDLSIGSQLSEGQVLQVPNAYGKRTFVLVDPKTFLPVSVSVYDDRGLFERYEFSSVIVNQPIPNEEFSKGYKGYKL